MKKVFQSPKHKLASKRRSYRLNKAKLKKKKKIRKRNLFLHPKNQIAHPTRRPHVKFDKKKKQHIIDAPKNFSILTNIEEMINFYESMTDYARKGLHIFIDLSKVENITPEAILYIIRLFHYYKLKFNGYQISGNIPINTECKTLLMDSGFFKYVVANIPEANPNENVFQIESDEHVQSKVAQKVMIFFRRHLKIEKTSIVSKSIYKTIIECMSNANNHAYKEHSILPKWYIMAQYDKSESKVSFAVLDGGFGIPTTIRRRNREELKSFVSRTLGLRINIDGDLLLSTLKGDFRTRTNLGNRGKGLPTIYSYAKGNRLNNLKVISNYGYINCDDDRITKLSSKFMGTLLCWDYS